MEQDTADIGPELLVAVLSGEAGLHEEARVKAWREADPANEARFQELARSWEGLSPLEVRPGAPPRTAADIVRLSSRTESEAPRRASVPVPGAPLPGSRRTRPSRFLRAVQLVAALLVGFLMGSYQDRLPPAVPSGAQEVVTEPGQQATVRLADGTVVRLAPGSRLQVPDGDQREVSLEGRAYFAVSPLPGRRFRVHTREGTITVYGTRFDVGVGEEGLDVIVVDGQVAVESSGGSVDLSGSQAARVEGGAAPMVRMVDDVYAATAWTGAFLAFEATPLREAALELEHRLGVRMRVQDADLLDRSITGWFVQQDPSLVVEAICAAVDARCVLDGDSIVVSLPVTP